MRWSEHGAAGAAAFEVYFGIDWTKVFICGGRRPPGWIDTLVQWFATGPSGLFAAKALLNVFAEKAAWPGDVMQALRVILPEDIEWRPFAAFPPSVRLAIIVGQPSEPGPYMIRIRVPHGVRLMPHRHPEDRIYTVMSGVFYVGLGDHFDADKLQAYPPGSVIVLPGDTNHFHWAKSSEYITQVTATGPLGLEYIDSKDDPRINSL